MSQVFENGVHEKPDLFEVFHARRTREFDGESGGLLFP